MNFQKKLTDGRFAVLVEMNTPKGIDISEMVTNVGKIKNKADAVVIPDMDNGVMRMSALAGGVLMQQQGMEAVIHTYCRDKNRMALQGDLLAAHVLGIRNLIVAHSEEIQNTDHQDAKPVWDIDETELIRTIQTLKDGADLSGFELKGAPEFFAGCTMNPTADADIDMELDKVKKKVEAGAQFLIAPAVFDVDRFAAFMEKARPIGVPVIATVFLIKSVGIARYMSRNEPGAHISEEMIKRIRQASDRERECLKIAGETIAAVKGIAQGAVIVTLGWENRLPAIFEYAGI